MDWSVLELAFIQRALIAALILGLVAPTVGIYLVQRRLALLGDGIGHIAFAGAGLGVLLGGSPILVAVIVSVLGAVALEAVRVRMRTGGDLALALFFYGGIAIGALLFSMQKGPTVSMQTFLFGSILTVSTSELWTIAVLGALVLVVTVGLRRVLFSVSHDEDFAKVSGIPVSVVNVLLAVMAALTVSVAMRVVGLLLVSAMLVVPVAAASQLTRSFRATLAGAVGIAVAVSAFGVLGSYPLDVATGPLIVVTALVVFFGCAVLGRLLRRGG